MWRYFEICSQYKGSMIISTQKICLIFSDIEDILLVFIHWNVIRITFLEYVVILYFRIYMCYKVDFMQEVYNPVCGHLVNMVSVLFTRWHCMHYFKIWLMLYLVMGNVFIATQYVSHNMHIYRTIDLWWYVTCMLRNDWECYIYYR